MSVQLGRRALLEVQLVPLEPPGLELVRPVQLDLRVHQGRRDFLDRRVRPEQQVQ